MIFKFITMKKAIQLSILLYIAFIFFNIAPCNGQKATEFKLHGIIGNTYNGKIIFTCTSVSDTLNVNNGSFIIAGNIQYPELACLEYANQRLFFYIEPREMNLVIPSSLSDEFNLSGSETQKENEEFENMTLASNTLRDSISKIYTKISEEEDSQQKLRLEFLIDSLFQERELISIKFIKQHSNSFVSLYRLASLNKDEYPVDSIRGWFNHLSNNLRNSQLGNKVDKTIRLLENTNTSFIAPDFTTISYNGEKISLSSFRGKTVILEFWASWCVPCMKSIPHLKTIYHKYKDRGLVVIGISTDNDKSRWANTIKRYQLNIWPQVLDKEKVRKECISDLEIATLYSTTPVPKMIVINKEGKIIKK